MRIAKERKNPSKADVPKLYAYNECEHSVNCKGATIYLTYSLSKDIEINKNFSGRSIFQAILS